MTVHAARVLKLNTLLPIGGGYGRNAEEGTKRLSTNPAFESGCVDGADLRWPTAVIGASTGAFTGFSSR
ncbi:MAG: hypothetical protein ACOCZ7_01640 [Armatimonadota bacterium]